MLTKIFCRLYPDRLHHPKPSKMYICLPAPFYAKSISFPTVKMGVAQKTMFSISDRLAKFFGKSGAPMEHNTTAKSKQTFF